MNTCVNYKTVVYINKYTTYENIKDKLPLVNTVFICNCNDSDDDNDDYNYDDNDDDNDNDLNDDNDLSDDINNIDSKNYNKLISDLQNYQNIKSITLCWGFNKNKNSSKMLLNLIPKHINNLQFTNINNFYNSTEVLKILKNFKKLIKIEINTIKLDTTLPFFENQNIITTQLDNLPESLEELNIMTDQACNCKFIYHISQKNSNIPKNCYTFCTCDQTCIQHKKWCIYNNNQYNDNDNGYKLALNNLPNALKKLNITLDCKKSNYRLDRLPNNLEYLNINSDFYPDMLDIKLDNLPSSLKILETNNLITNYDNLPPINELNILSIYYEGELNNLPNSLKILHLQILACDINLDCLSDSIEILYLYPDYCGNITKLPKMLKKIYLIYEGGNINNTTSDKLENMLKNLNVNFEYIWSTY